ncbi:hypothetical protein FA95DRAFT_336413 [Auriscalpium vulgare]|uniref:Uncharacterized protein n=1 Tax=Auriscalpium vulgare TaxID=40419 RepID=A0ACB8RIV2_9AGAM|nr:hypothetical protein FA95DRAFT_336413 [Auriscalpium vulgare]
MSRLSMSFLTPLRLIGASTSVISSLFSASASPSQRDRKSRRVLAVPDYLMHMLSSTDLSCDRIGGDHHHDLDMPDLTGSLWHNFVIPRTERALWVPTLVLVSQRPTGSHGVHSGLCLSTMEHHRSKISKSTHMAPLRCHYNFSAPAPASRVAINEAKRVSNEAPFTLPRAHLAAVRKGCIRCRTRLGLVPFTLHAVSSAADRDWNLVVYSGVFLILGNRPTVL